MSPDLPPKKVLEWYLEAGVDETIGEVPCDRFAETQASETPVEPSASAHPAAPAAQAPAADRSISAPTAPTSTAPAESAVSDASRAARAVRTIDELRGVLEGFSGCALKKTATNTVFGDGNPEAPIVFIGEAPGAEEDRKGVPFVGPSGQLLDRMLGSIGLDRTKVFISNTVFWRPPGNRNPTTGEMAVCLPFIERLIELIDPMLLVAVGGPAANSLLAQNASVSRLRGRWFPYSSPGLPRPIEATAIYHPAYLLRSPGQKRAAWQDMLGLRHKLVALSLL